MPKPPRMPTLEDVARLAGVSRATASRAIIEPTKVSPERRALVEDAMARLGYVPNAAARSLVTQRTDSIAVLVPEPSGMVFVDPFFQAVISGANSELADTMYQLVLLIGDSTGHMKRVRHYLRSRLVDGAVVVSHHGSDGVVESAVDAGLPLVLVGRPFAPGLDVPYVDVDNLTGGKIATERLIAQGCRRIGIVTGPLDMSAGRDRYEGFRLAMEAAGLRVAGIWHGQFDRPSGAATGARIEPGEVDGLFVCNDLMALGVMDSLAASGISVPDDVKVVGYDAISLGEHATPPLTTVTNPASEMAALATSMLLEQLKTGVRPQSRELQPVLVERASG